MGDGARVHPLSPVDAIMQTFDQKEPSNSIDCARLESFSLIKSEGKKLSFAGGDQTAYFYAICSLSYSGE